MFWDLGGIPVECVVCVCVCATLIDCCYIVCLFFVCCCIYFVLSRFLCFGKISNSFVYTSFLNHLHIILYPMLLQHNH